VGGAEIDGNTADMIHFLFETDGPALAIASVDSKQAASLPQGSRQISAAPSWCFSGFASADVVLLGRKD
jgi:hypothetical protein